MLGTIPSEAKQFSCRAQEWPMKGVKSQSGPNAICTEVGHGLEREREEGRSGGYQGTEAVVPCDVIAAQ